MQDLKIVFIQPDLIWADPAANRNMFDRWFRTIHSYPDIIVLPETFNTGFPVDPKVFAESVEGESMAWLRDKAVHSKAVVCASLLLETDGKYYNSLIWMKPDGTFSRYDKRHVFRMGGEDESISPGQEIITENLKGWKIRPMICYDLRFPVWCRNRYAHGAHDYDLLLFVANWPKVRSYPWNQLLIARAIENQAYVLGVNRVGKDVAGIEYDGDSCLIDPKGNIIVAADQGKEALVEVTVSYKELLDFRTKFNVGLDWDTFKI